MNLHRQMADVAAHEPSHQWREVEREHAQAEDDEDEERVVVVEVVGAAEDDATARLTMYTGLFCFTSLDMYNKGKI